MKADFLLAIKPRLLSVANATITTMKREPTVEEWLNSLAAKQPTPGGGAVAALSSAIAAALIGMVSIYTTGLKFANESERMQVIHDDVARLRADALKLMSDDEVAFRAVGDAYKLPNETANQKAARADAIKASLVAACLPPKQVIELARKLIPLNEELVENCNINVISDVAVAATNIKAAIEAAIVNIEINRNFIKDKLIKNELGKNIEEARASILQADKIVDSVEQRINSK